MVQLLFSVWFSPFYSEDREAKDKHMSYIGPTPLSMLVEYKGQEIYDEITNLLTDGSKWEPVWELVAPDGHAAKARELILALLLKCAASWQHRFLQHLKSFPLKLLVMIQKPGLEADPKRQQAAQDLLDKSACCIDSVHSDIAEKVKKRYSKKNLTM